MFFTCTPNFELEEQGLVLFSANLDGTEIKKIGDDVDSFCIYQDDIYMITTGDLGYLHKYDFDNNIFKKIYTGALSCGYLDFSQNRIFGYEH